MTDRNSARRWEYGVAIKVGCVIPGDEGRDGVMVPLTCNCVVVVSSSLPQRKSTARPKCRKKSVPRMGCCTSAMTNTHLNVRRRPRLSERVSRDVCSIDCLKVEVPSLFAVGARGGHDAHLRASIYKET